MCIRDRNTLAGIEQELTELRTELRTELPAAQGPEAAASQQRVEMPEELSLIHI